MIDDHELNADQDSDDARSDTVGAEAGLTHDTSGSDEASDSQFARMPRGLYLTPRQTFMTLAGVLAVLLLALLAYLVWLQWPADFSTKGGKVQAGIEPVVAIYGPGRGAKPKFNKPMGAAWGRGGRIYVADTQNSRVVVFDKDGTYRSEFGGFGIAKPLDGAKMTWKPGLLDYPTDIAVDSRNGDVYVADFFNDSISAFTSEGKFLRRFPDPNKPTGRGGSGSGGLGIAVTSLTVRDGKVYATDTYQVLVFSTGGKLLKQFGQPGLDPGMLDHPNGIAADTRGNIYVSDSNHNRVTAYDSDGKVLWTTGVRVSDLRKETDNPFVLPRGLTVLRDGSIVVSDPLGQQLVKIDEDGKVIATYGVRGAEPGQLNFPNDVSALKDLVLISDRANDRVQVVRLIGR